MINHWLLTASAFRHEWLTIRGVPLARVLLVVAIPPVFGLIDVAFLRFRFSQMTVSYIPEVGDLFRNVGYELIAGVYDRCAL